MGLPFLQFHMEFTKRWDCPLFLFFCVSGAPFRLLSRKIANNTEVDERSFLYAGNCKTEKI